MLNTHGHNGGISKQNKIRPAACRKQNQSIRTDSFFFQISLDEKTISKKLWLICEIWGIFSVSFQLVCAEGKPS